MSVKPVAIHNDLCRLAVDNLLYPAGKRALNIGIFYAIHTYGRRLNWHPHVHVSVTCGGINEHGKWKKISFRKDAMRARWMWNIRQLLLNVWSDGIAMPSSLSHITSESQWHSGTVAQWHSGTVAQWHSGTVAQFDTDRRRRLLACIHVKKDGRWQKTP